MQAEVQKVHAITEQDKVWRSKLQLMEKAKKERGVHNKEVGRPWASFQSFKDIMASSGIHQMLGCHKCIVL